MKRDQAIDNDSGPVSAQIRIVDHIGVTAIDLWLDEDSNGRPDKFDKRMKEPNDRENQLIQIGNPDELIGKILQWIWMPSQPPNSTDAWTVVLNVQQSGASLNGFPLHLTGNYPPEEKYGIFETWIRFVKR